jgi:hypothetical protein
MRGARKRRQRAYNDMMTAAYYGGIVPHQKTLVPLKDLLAADAPPPRRVQSWQQQLSIARQWDAAINAR